MIEITQEMIGPADPVASIEEEYAADHGGYVLKEEVARLLRGKGHEVEDFGAFQFEP